MLKPRAAWIVVCSAVTVTVGYGSAQPTAALLGEAQLRPAAEAQTASPTTAQNTSTAETLRPVIDRYCITCHNARLKTAGLTLDGLDYTRLGHDAETWERVARKLRTHEMPPPGLP